MTIDFLYRSDYNNLSGNSSLWLGETHVGYSTRKCRAIPQALVDFGTILYLVSLFDETFVVFLLSTTTREFQHGQLPTSSIFLHDYRNFMGARLYWGDNIPMPSDPGSMENQLSWGTVLTYSGRGDRTCYFRHLHGSHYIYPTHTEGFELTAPQKADADVDRNVCRGRDVRISFIRKSMRYLLTNCQCLYSRFCPRPV